MKKKPLLIGIIVVLVLAISGGSYYMAHKNAEQKATQKAKQFIQILTQQQFDQLPSVVSNQSLQKAHYTKQTFIDKYTNIFNGIGAENLKASDLKISKIKNGQFQFSYKLNLATGLGKLPTLSYKGRLIKQGKDYVIDWQPNLIFPHMEAADKISYTEDDAVRGKILDKNGSALATNAEFHQAGIIPKELGKGTERTENINAIAQQFHISVKEIEAKLDQKWVKEDLFVPLKVVEDDQIKKMTAVQYQAVDIRYYPLGKAASTMIGYTGKVTAEDLKKDKTLSADANIGKSGLERAYDKELRGKNGGKISLIDQNGKVKEVLLEAYREDGKDLQLTIDANTQVKAYNALDNATGATVIMQPKTGELSALVSKPSYDPNLMIRGISQKEYDAYLNDERKPFANRFTQRYAPGSTLKTVTASVALDAGTLTTDKTRTISGLKWQKDKSWGNYYITRVSNVPKVNLETAFIYSDNIFFAQTGLEMGEKILRKGFNQFIFGEKLDLPFSMEPAQISNKTSFKSQILLADTAYGQGQVLMSPIQQAITYSAFANNGKIIYGHLLANEKTKAKDAVSSKSAEIVHQAMTQVIQNPNGTAHILNGISSTLAAKTGTAELKQTQGTKGQENSFIVAFDTKKSQEFLVLSVVEDHQKIGKTATELAKPLIKELEK
ncbi:penicillin-binding transpeptidase domain-containing protein [Rummeliibacillus suwonensis]|uniref:penicillin-binding protein PBP4(5) n=1 Tax=Rummeliibacillus suwonensis TaxID=1306154 RepID=UPI001AAF2267|nr:penicillin-binding transpeptidase domain-containing protein [Rummeliibacillus suwonensis]MBO2536680.1 penicillin-binding protein [Rummeliibacillus suwonensis]